MKKVEDILFYAKSNVRPPEKGLERILDKLPVTDYLSYRYTYIMGTRIALPLGIIALAFVALLVFGNSAKTNPTKVTAVLPATVTKENVDSSLNKVNSVISESENEADQDLKELDQEEELDQEDTQQNSEDGSNEGSDNLKDL